MQRLIAFLLTGLLPLALASQSLERKVVASAGASVKAGNLQVDYTVGEAVVQTLATGSLILTQGFQQGDPVVTGVWGLPANVRYRVFPNPASTEILVELEGPKLDYYVALVSLSGQVLGGFAHYFNGSGKLERAFDLSNLPAGVYFVVFKDRLGQPLASVRVVKQ